jgi:hypothetical protein
MSEIIKEIGYAEALAKEFRSRGAFLARELYWNLFEAHTVEHVLADHRAHFLDHHSYYEWAKFIVSTKDQSPEETCAEILDLVTPGASA